MEFLPNMASTQVETVSTGADKARLAVAGLLVVAALAAFYLLGGQGSLAQWGSLIAGPNPASACWRLVATPGAR